MTYSILARDPVAGLLGAAVASCNLSVGPRVVAVEAGVGAAAAQSGCEVWHRLLLIDLLRRGLSAERAIEAFRGQVGVDGCQVGVVDGTGAAVSWTGPDCRPE